MSDATREVVFDLEQTAQMLRVSESLVRKLIRNGELQAITIGTRRVIPGWSIDAFIREREAAAGIVRPAAVPPRKTTSAAADHRLGQPIAYVLRPAKSPVYGGDVAGFVGLQAELPGDGRTPS